MHTSELKKIIITACWQSCLGPDKLIMLETILAGVSLRASMFIFGKDHYIKFCITTISWQKCWRWISWISSSQQDNTAWESLIMSCISCVLCLCLRIRLNFVYNYCVTFLGEECCHGDVTCVRIMPSIIMGTMHPCCVKNKYGSQLQFIHSKNT